MTGISMSGNLPGGDGNGLIAILNDLIHDPKRMHVAVVILDARRVISDSDSGEVFPVARIKRIEVIREPDDREVCERLMRRALDQRSGREGLPYDLESEITEAFASAFEDVNDDDDVVDATIEDDDEDEA